MMILVYKIVDSGVWADAVKAGVFNGAAIDLRDGYIHLSSAEQAVETARLHFAGDAELLLVAFDSAVFGQDLKWEPSRGGSLFPHVYASIDPATAVWAKAMPWNGAAHDFPQNWQS
jgi:uncharacterized protein (DUF952 family)